MNGKSIVDAIIALILFVVFAIIYFLILGFVIKFASELIADGDVSANYIAIAASILSGLTIYAGGGFSVMFGREE